MLNLKLNIRYLAGLASASLLTVALTSWVVLNAQADELFQYEVSVQGPLASLDESCTDPCFLGEVHPVGRTSATVEESGSEFKPSKLNSDPAVRCSGNCISGKQKSGLSLSMPSELKEGLEFSIEDGIARLVVYRVTDTDSGKKTLKQHSRFEVDRELISLNLRDHDIRIVRTPVVAD